MPLLTEQEVLELKEIRWLADETVIKLLRYYNRNALIHSTLENPTIKSKQHLERVLNNVRASKSHNLHLMVLQVNSATLNFDSTPNHYVGIKISKKLAPLNGFDIEYTDPTGRKNHEEIGQIIHERLGNSITKIYEGRLQYISIEEADSDEDILGNYNDCGPMLIYLLTRAGSAKSLPDLNSYRGSFENKVGYSKYIGEKLRNIYVLSNTEYLDRPYDLGNVDILLKEYLIEENPFKWQVQEQYNKLVLFFKSISEKDMAGMANKIIKEMERLSQDKHEIFERIQNYITDQIVERLNEHLSDTVFSREAYYSPPKVRDDLNSASSSSSSHGMNHAERAYVRGWEQESDPSDVHRSSSDSGTATSKGSHSDDSLSLRTSPCSETLSGISLSSDEDARYEAWRQARMDYLGDLDDIKNLLEICMSDGEGYGWLVNELVEGEFRFSENLIEEMDFKKLGISKNTVEIIVGALWSLLEWEAFDITDNDYVLNTFKHALEIFTGRRQLEFRGKIYDCDDEKNYVIDGLSSQLLFNTQTMPQQMTLIEQQYNEAYRENNLVKMQALWALYHKYRAAASKKKLFENDSSSTVSRASYASSLITVENFNKKGTLLTIISAALKRISEYHAIKVYPDHNVKVLKYSAEKAEKVATLDLVETFGTLESIGREIEKVRPIRSDGAKHENILVPILCFVVSTKPHKKDGPHSREIIQVPLDLNMAVRLLSKAIRDGIFKETSDFRGLAQHDYYSGMSIVHREAEAREKFTQLKPSAQEINHSERVLIEVLRNEINIDYIVSILRLVLDAKYRLKGIYKVYSVALLMYSTNSICTFCTPPILAVQNSYENGF